jgi:hypothetical protein
MKTRSDEFPMNLASNFREKTEIRQLPGPTSVNK